MPTIDSRVLKTLHGLGQTAGVPLVPQLVARFETTAPKRLEEVRTAIRDGRMDALAAAAHVLGSACGNLGASGALEICRQIELAARRGEDDAGRLLDELETELALARQALQAEVAGGEPR